MGRVIRLLTLGLCLMGTSPAAAELLLGGTAGLVIPGDQDMTFKQYPPGGGPATSSFEQRDVDESLGPMAGASVTAWGGSGLLQYLGLQGEALYWYMQSKGAPAPGAPRVTAEQHRLGFLLNVLARVPVYPSPGRFPSEQGGDAFLYGGAGAGPAYTRVSGGAKDWNVAYQLLAGISVGMTPNIRLRVESRYLLAHDADTTPADGPGLKVDVSGTPTSFRTSRHQDTRFIPILVGLDWRF